MQFRVSGAGGLQGVGISGLGMLTVYGFGASRGVFEKLLQRLLWKNWMPSGL